MLSKSKDDSGVPTQRREGGGLQEDGQIRSEADANALPATASFSQHSEAGGPAAPASAGTQTLASRNEPVHLHAIGAAHR
jgi:hypothetical protein